MTRRRPDPDEMPAEDQLLDLLMGDLEPEAQAALEARLAVDPSLAAKRAWTDGVFAAERSTFEPAMPAGVWEADAARMAARVRDEAALLERRADETRTRPLRVRRRGWAQVLAFSVGLHVVVLGVIALVAGGRDDVVGDDAAPFSFRADSDFRETEQDLAHRDTVLRYSPIAYDEVELTDRVVLSEQETVSDELPLEVGAGAPDARVNDHPVGVFVPMSRRKHVPTKKSRLRLLGFNANGTMRAVEKGLRFLGGEQRADGSFAAGGDRSAVEQTSLVMLAFLADGHCSRHRDDDPHGRVVARGIAWLRGRVGALDGPQAKGTGLATMALCEDYMLSYGWLSPADAQRRVTEIATLSDSLRQAPARVDAVATPWRTWAIDAAARAGVIESTRDDRRMFTAWVQEASTANGTLSATSAFGALAVSTALLYLERGADKPRFLSWSRSHAEQLAGRLSPIGKAKDGHPVGETASILLALQVAYRTY